MPSRQRSSVHKCAWYRGKLPHILDATNTVAIQSILYSAQFLAFLVVIGWFEPGDYPPLCHRGDPRRYPPPFFEALAEKPAAPRRHQSSLYTIVSSSIRAQFLFGWWKLRIRGLHIGQSCRGNGYCQECFCEFRAKYSKTLRLIHVALPLV